MVINIPQYIHSCAPDVPVMIMTAIIKTESKGNPLKIGVNRGYKLAHQPHTIIQAKQWITYLDKHGYNFDVGITQINIKNLHKAGYTADQALDPCLNIRLGNNILHKYYLNALHKTDNKYKALLYAISAYNTGNFYSGFSNGYVQKIIYVAGKNIDTKKSNMSSI